MTETEKKSEKDRSGDENNLPKSIEYLQYISVFILLVLDGLLIAVILIVSRLNIVVEEGSTIDGFADLEGSATLSTSDRGIAQAGHMFYFPLKKQENKVGQAREKIFSGPVNGEVVPELEKTVVIILLVCVALVFFILLEVAIWGCRRRRNAKELSAGDYDVNK